METREVKVRISGIGQGRYRARTQCRQRQCKRCRFRWKTLELPIRRGSNIWTGKAVEKVSRRANSN